MKNMLYMTLEEDINNNSGVMKKINSQISIFKEAGINTTLSGYLKNGYAIKYQDEIKFTQISKGILKNVKIFDFVYEFIQINKINILYVRKFRATLFSDIFFKKIKQLGVLILLEIPTYPYDGEVTTLKSKIGLSIDRIYRNKYKNYISRIVTYSKDLDIFDTKCINISNGISESEILENYIDKDTKSLNFISVSSLCDWHGVDRFIKSLADYNGIFDVKFHIVGPRNSIYDSLKKLIDLESLGNKVIMYGYLSGKELEDLYQQTHVAIGSLGRHRSNIFNLSSLKNREYLAKALPIVYSENDYDMDDKLYSFKVSPDESVFNIDEILDWYFNLNIKESNMLVHAHKFSWNNQLKDVIDFIIDN